MVTIVESFKTPLELSRTVEWNGSLARHPLIAAVIRECSKDNKFDMHLLAWLVCSEFVRSSHLNLKEVYGICRFESMPRLGRE